MAVTSSAKADDLYFDLVGMKLIHNNLVINDPDPFPPLEHLGQGAIFKSKLVVMNRVYDWPNLSTACR